MIQNKATVNSKIDKRNNNLIHLNDNNTFSRTKKRWAIWPFPWIFLFFWDYEAVPGHWGWVRVSFKKSNADRKTSQYCTSHVPVSVRGVPGRPWGSFRTGDLSLGFSCSSFQLVTVPFNLRSSLSSGRNTTARWRCLDGSGQVPTPLPRMEMERKRRRGRASGRRGRAQGERVKRGDALYDFQSKWERKRTAGSLFWSWFFEMTTIRQNLLNEPQTKSTNEQNK